MNPLTHLLQGELPAVDVVVMAHGFADHGRDYFFLVENGFAPVPGTFRLTFTHVVDFRYETAVGDDAWRRSWGDEFIDYARWEASGEPDGYIFGTNWSVAYPGFEASDSDPVASSWSERLQRPMYAATIETDRFRIALIFHDVRFERVSDDASVASRLVVPLSP